MEKKKYGIIMVGNPGVGKSTIASSILRKSFPGQTVEPFPSGVTFGSGMTLETEWKELPDGNLIADTPGLEDAKMRQECARQINIALTKANNPDGYCVFKILFVCNSPAGRIRPADINMINTITRALPKGIKYNMVVNQMRTKTLKKLLGDDEAKRQFLGPLADGFHYLPETLSFISYDPNADDAKDAILDVKATICDPKNCMALLHRDLGLLGWTHHMEQCIYKAEDVKDMFIRDWQERMDKLETRLKELMEQNMSLQKRLGQLTDKYNQQLKEQAAALNSSKQRENEIRNKFEAATSNDERNRQHNNEKKNGSCIIL